MYNGNCDVNTIDSIAKQESRVVQSLLENNGLMLIVSFFFTAMRVPKIRDRSLIVNKSATKKIKKLFSLKMYIPQRTALKKILSANGSSISPILEISPYLLATYPSRKSLIVPSSTVASCKVTSQLRSTNKKIGAHTILNTLIKFGICLNIPKCLLSDNFDITKEKFNFNSSRFMSV